MRVQRMREELASELNLLVDELAPALFDDFSASRIIPSTTPGPQRRDSAQGKFFQHPLSWVDELFFGPAWSSSMAYPQDRHVRPNQGEPLHPPAPGNGAESDMDGAFTDGQGTGSGYVSGYTTEEAPDYDEVIHILNREQGHPDSPAVGSGARPTISRRASRQRSRSGLNLAAMSPVSPTTPLSSATASGAQAGSSGAEARRRGAGQQQDE